MKIKHIIEKIRVSLEKQVEKMMLEFKFEVAEETEKEQKNKKIQMQSDGKSCV